MRLILPQALLRALARQGEAAYPEEAAGLILGRDGAARRAVRLAPLENTWQAGERRRRYRLDPRALLRAEEQAEAEGLEVIGVYHSHPDHPPVASQTDLAWAVPWYVYVITAVEAGRAGPSRAWQLTDDRARMLEVEVVVEGGAAAREVA